MKKIIFSLLILTASVSQAKDFTLVFDDAAADRIIKAAASEFGFFVGVTDGTGKVLTEEEFLKKEVAELLVKKTIEKESRKAGVDAKQAQEAQSKADLEGKVTTGQ